MELYIYSKERQLVGIVESFEYLRWTRRYARCGTFEMKAIATSENISLLRTGNYLWKSDDEEIVIIEQVELEQAGRETVTVSGRFATSLLARRIVCRAVPGDALSAGQRYGMIKLGSRTELVAPADARWQVAVRVGQCVRAGTTVLARWTETGA